MKKMKKTLFTLTAALIISVAAYGQQQQEERIIRFHADIVIDTTGRVEITERIRVYAAGDEIKRGIIREIPLSRLNKYGKRVPVDYKILLVTTDAPNPKYRDERKNGNLVISIGDSETLLEAGEYDYTVVYETYGQIGFFDDYDELYWNVTGNTSIFTVEEASAAITLPEGANAIQAACYTGKKGSKESACTVDDRGRIQMFTTTRPLAPGEGFTVAAGFTRDIISRPPPPTQLETFWYRHKAWICLLSGLLICAGYFYSNDRKAGKKHRQPVAIPTFKPPRDLSPASVNYLYKRIFDDNALGATLIEMAAKGAMHIRYDGKRNALREYTLVNTSQTEHLRPEEQELHATIFKGTDNVRLDNTYSENMYNAQKNLKESLAKQWNMRAFITTEGVGKGFGMLLLFFAIFIAFMGMEVTCMPMLAASPFISIAFLCMTPAPANGGIGHWLMMFFVFVIAELGVALVIVIVFTIGVDAEMRDLINDFHAAPTVFFAVTSLMYCVYAKRMERLTLDGAQLFSELEGFRMYLKTAEEHRLNMLTPPDRTPELFERLLPYAVALDVSNDWCKKFGDVLLGANYSPDWYDNKKDFTGGLSATGMVSSFTSLGLSFRSTVTSSGSTDYESGSGGGGSSGGGGGGGGVRGW